MIVAAFSIVRCCEHDTRETYLGETRCRLNLARFLYRMMHNVQMVIYNAQLSVTRWCS